MATLMRIQHAPGIVEFRVQARRRTSIFLLAAYGPATAITALFIAHNAAWHYRLLTIILLGWLFTPGILHESLLVFQHLGVQLETSRGYFGLPLSTSSEFIPAASINDIVINEALSAWQFKHYLAILQSRPTASQGPKLSVAFKNILPPVTLLSEIYRHIHGPSDASQTAQVP